MWMAGVTMTLIIIPWSIFSKNILASEAKTVTKILIFFLLKQTNEISSNNLLVFKINPNTYVESLTCY